MTRGCAALLGRLSRRQTLGLIGTAAVAGTASTALGLFLSPPPLREPDIRRSLSAPPEFGAGNELVAGPALLHLTAEGEQAGFGYNNAVPGPTIRLESGEIFGLRFRNELRDATTVHWHGLVVPPAMDDHPADELLPQNTFDVSYPIIQRAGLNWYHPHPHENVAAQVWLGLAGLFVVEDEEERALNLPSGERELLLVLRDARISSGGRFRYDANSSGRLGDFPIVNGIPYPAAELTNGVYRLRILNGANARVFRLSVDHATMTLIGNDGGLLERPVQVDEVTLSSGERVDILFDLRELSTGETANLQCRDAGWNLLQMHIRENISEDWQTPERLSTIATLTHEGPVDRTFRFENNRRINGQEYDMALTDFVVPFGRVERWRFESRGGAPHPIHVHGAHFQVQSRDGGRDRVMPWETGWKDTVLLQEGEAVEVLIVFDRYEGRYLLHCHKLEHEDHGMMMNFVVSRDPETAEARAASERLFGPLCTTPSA